MSARFLPLHLSVVVFAAIAGLPQQSAKANPPPFQQVAEPGASAPNEMEQEKIFLNRLVTELKRSARSFIYLRSRGFDLTDEQFEHIIAKNNDVLRRIRIVRRDEQGVRQIPGWPGVALTTEYKTPPSDPNR